MDTAVQHALIERFARHLQTGSTDLAPACLRVPAAHYVDAAQTAAEVERLFRRRPLLVALTPDLPAPGDFLTHDVLETPLLLVRGDDGVVRAFVNACRHRGTRIATGRGSRRTFTCPYHAWNYDCRGKVMSRPNSCGGFDGADARFDALAEVACTERDGLVFVVLEGGDIEAQVAALIDPVADDLRGYRIAECVHQGGRSGERPCNYKFIIDGFTESYHIAALHKHTIRPYYYTVPSLADAFGDVVRMIGVRRSIDAELKRPPGERELLPHGTTQYLLVPNVVLVHQVEHIQFWRVYPVHGSPDRCRMQVDLYWPAPIDDEARRKAAFNLDVLWQVTTEEDMPQSVAIHDNLRAGAAPDMVFGRNEPALIHYHQRIAAGIGSDALVEMPPP